MRTAAAAAAGRGTAARHAARHAARRRCSAGSAAGGAGTQKASRRGAAAAAAQRKVVGGGPGTGSSSSSGSRAASRRAASSSGSGRTAGISGGPGGRRLGACACARRGRCVCGQPLARGPAGRLLGVAATRAGAAHTSAASASRLPLHGTPASNPPPRPAAAGGRRCGAQPAGKAGRGLEGAQGGATSVGAPPPPPALPRSVRRPCGHAPTLSFRCALAAGRCPIDRRPLFLCSTLMCSNPTPSSAASARGSPPTSCPCCPAPPRRRRPTWSRQMRRRAACRSGFPPLRKGTSAFMGPPMCSCAASWGCEALAAFSVSTVCLTHLLRCMLDTPADA